MSGSNWPCDLFRTDCTYISTPARVTPPGLQILDELIPHGLEIITESIPPFVQMHARVTPPGLATLTELPANNFQHQLAYLHLASSPY